MPRSRRPPLDPARDHRQGHEHLSEIQALHEAHAELTFGILGDAERAALLDVLDRLRDHVAGRLPEPGDHRSPPVA
ncbi:hypothetical protein Amsp01_105550 [Amycolatopsis sp. NBRC 101858]|uniref:hypothetical protein n=1 Tax=Amycolatopsis sp. NBRC 101858 TaxID=3032200 RepID=UPI0024A4DBEE|nr:hypothetical protein [Amycolatopsis sp. NBRC 101858]GLY44532.1 hypothetical protein Amsp01_105550 [Amycolatopsis sp. NBRC 101858]